MKHVKVYYKEELRTGASGEAISVRRLPFVTTSENLPHHLAVNKQWVEEVVDLDEKGNEISKRSKVKSEDMNKAVSEFYQKKVKALEKELEAVKSAEPKSSAVLSDETLKEALLAKGMSEKQIEKIINS